MPSLLGVVASSVFTPLDLSPTMWFDAADTLSITSSGSPAKVSKWADKSGNNYHAEQAVSANQPTTGATTINGRNVISFNAASWLVTPSGFNPSTNGITVFAVAKATDTPGNKQLMAQENLSGTGRTWFLADGNEAYATVIGATQLTLSSGTTATVLVRVSCSAGASQTLTLSQNAGAVSATATRTIESTIGAAVIGASKAKASPFDGSAAEIVVYPRVLSATEVNLVETYLNRKWAIY